MFPSEASKRQIAVTGAVKLHFKTIRLLVMMMLFGSNVAMMLQGGSSWLAAHVMIVVLQTVLYRQLSELSTYSAQFALSLLRPIAHQLGASDGFVWTLNAFAIAFAGIEHCSVLILLRRSAVQ